MDRWKTLAEERPSVNAQGLIAAPLSRHRFGTMQGMNRFQAPWSMTVKLVSAIASLIVGGSAVLVANIPQVPLFTALTPIAILVGGALFTVRGYELTPRDLLVKRLLWKTRVELDGLQRAWASPEAMQRSFRVFGNGGFFSISGLYRNKKLGNYRALATDSKNAVVLDLGDRKVVVTPDNPAALLQAMSDLGFEGVEV